MNIRIFFLALALPLAACGAPTKSMNLACNFVGPSVKVIYKASYLKADHKVTVKKSEAIRFRPDNRSTPQNPVPTALVTVQGRAAQGNFVDCSWLSGNGTTVFDVCIDQAAATGDCKYDVTVTGVGKLDPYAKIIP